MSSYCCSSRVVERHQKWHPMREARVRFPGSCQCHSVNLVVRRLWNLGCGTAVPSPEDPVLLFTLHALRTPGLEPGSQAWEACMMPLHSVRSHWPSQGAWY